MYTKTTSLRQSINHYSYCGSQILQILFAYVHNFSFVMPRSIQLFTQAMQNLNAIKQCYFRERKLKNKKNYKIMTFTIRYYSLILYSFILIHNILKKSINQCLQRGTVPLRSKNRLFLRPQLSLKSKTIAKRANRLFSLP